MANESDITTDHEQIRRWVEDRGGVPVGVEGTARGDDPGVLRIDFPGHGDDEGFRPLSWDAFFEKFDDAELAFVSQDRTSAGEPSRFCNFIRRGADAS